MEKQAGGNRAGTGLLGPGRSAAMTPRQLIEPARLAGSALLHTQSDARLVDLARAGNDRAFEAIVARYRRSLLRYCERLLPPGRAEDAVQQAFLNAYRAIGRNEAELNLRPWLYRVAHNSSLNLLRQNGWDYDEIPEDFDGVVQPPQALELRERLQELMRAVQEVPERQRDALVLRELEGRSYEEISATLGVTGGAVRQLLNRARGTLRTAATALTPPRLLESLVERASSPVTGQIAEISAGAGGAAGILKIGAALLVAGAVGGAVVAGPAHHLVLGGSGHSGGAAEAAAAGAGGGGGSGGGGSGGGYSSLGSASATGIGIGPALGHGEAAPGGFGSSGQTSGTAGTGGGGGRGSGGGGDGHSGGDGGSSGSGDSGSGSGSSGSGDGGGGSSGSPGSGSDGGSGGSPHRGAARPGGGGRGGGKGRGRGGRRPSPGRGRPPVGGA